MLSGLCLTLWLHCLWAADGLDAWTLRTNPVSNTNSLFSITYAINRFVAVGGDPAPGWEGRGVIVTSMDGSLWTQPRVSLGTLLHVTYGGGLFLAGPKAPGGIFNSRDGYSWASSLSGSRSLTVRFNSLSAVPQAKSSNSNFYRLKQLGRAYWCYTGRTEHGVCCCLSHQFQSALFPRFRALN
jgi:hypothetical protein